MTTPEAAFLEAVDAIAGGTALHTQISEPGIRPPIYSVQYLDRPDDGWITSFTVGLSSLPNQDWPHDQGPELALRMRSRDRRWGWAIAELACQGRSRRSFGTNVAIDFGTRISLESEMSGFLLVAPRTFPSGPICCEGRHISLLEALPLHADELARVRSSDREWLFRIPIDFADPSRPSAATG